MEENKIKELIEIELKMINFCFSISTTLGQKATLNSISEFYNWLCRHEGKKIFAPMNMEYRGFVIGILKGVDNKYIEWAVEAVLMGKGRDDK